jgi:hypothetical protein
LKFRRATLPAIRKDILASPLNLDTCALGEAVPSNFVFTPNFSIATAALPPPSQTIIQTIANDKALRAHTIAKALIGFACTAAD